MADQWYYAQEGQRRGPISEDELKRLASSGQLKATDKVWTKGITAWQPASEIEGLIPPPDPSDPPSLEPDPREPLEDATRTAKEWYYFENGNRTGPVSKEQLRQLVSGGQLTPVNLVWKHGMSQWVPLNRAISSAPFNPNMPPIPRATQPKGVSLGACRIALVLAVIAVFFPWVEMGVDVRSEASSFMGHQLVGGYAIVVNGIQIVWGVLYLLCAIGGLFFTFADPAKILKDKTKLGMAAIGGTLAIFVGIAITSIAPHFLAAISLALLLSRKLMLALAAYLAIFAGAAAAVFGYLTVWYQKQAS